MTANTSNPAVRVRFYGSLEAAMIAWAALMISIGGTFGIDRLPLYIATLGGMLAILGAAMKHPVYRRLREGSI